MGHLFNRFFVLTWCFIVMFPGITAANSASINAINNNAQPAQLIVGSDGKLDVVAALIYSDVSNQGIEGARQVLTQNSGVVTAAIVEFPKEDNSDLDIELPPAETILSGGPIDLSGAIYIPEEQISFGNATNVRTEVAKASDSFGGAGKALAFAGDSDGSATSWSHALLYGALENGMINMTAWEIEFDLQLGEGDTPDLANRLILRLPLSGVVRSSRSGFWEVELAGNSAATSNVVFGDFIHVRMVMDASGVLTLEAGNIIQSFDFGRKMTLETLFIGLSNRFTEYSNPPTVVPPAIIDNLNVRVLDGL